MTKQISPSGIRPRSKLILLGLSIILIVGFVIFGWRWAAGELQATIETKIDNVTQQGKTVTCNNLDVRGFPFRIGFFCSHTAYDDNKNRLGLTAGELRTTAQIYKPGHVISELDGPLQISSKTSDLEANWDNLKASSVFDLNNLSRASINADNIEILLIRTLLGDVGEISADNLQLHARQNEKDLDAAALATGLQLKTLDGKQIAPTAHLAAQAKFMNKADVLRHDNNRIEFALRNTNLRIEQLTIRTDDGAEVSATGPITISQQGLISGEILLSIKEFNKIIRLAQQYKTGLETDIANASQILSLLSASADNNQIDITLTLRNGAVHAGLFPLGFIPAI